ncbi:uncharacterized protein BXZ73DRAFT_84179 [Epithele typhae]|uniref:uncharacterized protein n=1 Tax=Epithele typhae TaxID=378194 RepID=UPI0020079F57|nr:uncharacterized protein BXZ73DRAFT_84179 [Epithele typhae]KAH9908832.1 hypothetical protein BXZ73DRAFT_84179 [Epithele typhae]
MAVTNFTADKVMIRRRQLGYIMRDVSRSGVGYEPLLWRAGIGGRRRSAAAVERNDPIFNTGRVPVRLASSQGGSFFGGFTDEGPTGGHLAQVGLGLGSEGLGLQRCGLPSGLGRLGSRATPAYRPAPTNVGRSGLRSKRPRASGVQAPTCSVIAITMPRRASSRQILPRPASSDESEVGSSVDAVDPAEKSLGAKFNLTKEEKNMLLEHLPRWKTNSNARKAINEALAGDIIRGRSEAPSSTLITLLMEKISQFMHNNSFGSKQDKNPFFSLRPFTGLRVFGYQADADIRARALNDEQFKTDQRWISAWTRARQDLWTELTEYQRSEYNRAAVLWTDKGAPEDVTINFDTSELLQEYKTRAKALAVFTQQDGWDKNFDDNFKSYFGAIIDPDSLPQETRKAMEELKSAVAPRPLFFKFYDDGLPKLRCTEDDGKSFTYSRRIKMIEEYIRIHLTNQEHFFAQEWLPDGFVFKTPDRFKVAEAKAFIQHIVDLEASGQAEDGTPRRFRLLAAEDKSSRVDVGWKPANYVKPSGPDRSDAPVIDQYQTSDGDTGGPDRSGGLPSKTHRPAHSLRKSRRFFADGHRKSSADPVPKKRDASTQSSQSSSPSSKASPLRGRNRQKPSQRRGRPKQSRRLRRGPIDDDPLSKVDVHEAEESSEEASRESHRSGGLFAGQARPPADAVTSDGDDGDNSDDDNEDDDDGDDSDAAELIPDELELLGNESELELYDTDLDDVPLSPSAVLALQKSKNKGKKVRDNSLSDSESIEKRRAVLHKPSLEMAPPLSAERLRTPGNKTPDNLLQYFISLSPGVDSWKHVLHRLHVKLDDKRHITPDPRVPWATWNNSDGSVDVSLHLESDRSLPPVLAYLGTPLSQDAPAAEVQRWALAMGLLLRSAKEAIDHEPDADGPVYLATSGLDHTYLDRLISICQSQFRNGPAALSPRSTPSAPKNEPLLDIENTETTSPLGSNPRHRAQDKVAGGPSWEGVQNPNGSRSQAGPSDVRGGSKKTGKRVKPRPIPPPPTEPAVGLVQGREPRTKKMTTKAAAAAEAGGYGGRRKAGR